jgi:membrane protease YdiL (CAAX protease family)
MVFVNAVLFSFAHIIFKSPLVLLLSLIAGVFIAVTYLKTKSLLLTSSEHALYGCWLFTVGMGEMLAFPLPK